MKLIEIDLRAEKIHIPDKKIGKIGESYVSGLKFILPEVFKGWNAFVDIESPTGKKNRVEVVNYVNNEIVYEFTSDDLSEKGRFLVELVLVNKEKVFKPFIGEFSVSYAICAEEDVNEDIPLIITSQIAEDIRLAAESRHSHENKTVVDALSKDENGELLYNGKRISMEIEEILAKDVTYTDPLSGGNLPLNIALDSYIVDNYNKLADLEIEVYDLGLDSHYHSNKSDILDKFSSENGELIFDGKPISGDISKNSEARHIHANKENVLDYFGINYAKTRPTFKGNSAGSTNILATQEDVATRVNNIKNKLEEQIGKIPKFSVVVVDTLPETDISETTVYLLKDADTEGNLYTEYIYVGGAWECLGSQSVDLDGYAKTEDIPTKISQLDNNSGFITETEIKTSVETALTEAKESGEFDGADGQNGSDGLSAYQIWLNAGNIGTEAEYLESLKGENGKTPEKGVDYFTSSDKEEIKLAVLEEIPDDFSQFIEETAASVNLYEPQTEGWTDDAMITSSGYPTVNTSSYRGYAVTPKIPVIGGKTYTAKPLWTTATTDAKNRARTYDSNGTPLAVMAFTNNDDGSVTFTVPDGSEAIQFSVLVTYFGGVGDENANDIDTVIETFNNTFMLVEGTTAPEVYEPYGASGYKLKDIALPDKSVNIVNVTDEALPIFAPLTGKKIANFGDSIFGNARPPEDVSTFLAEKTGAEVLNCAFGGCRMSTHTGHWDCFSMYRLAYSIANNDFALQDDAINYDDRTSYAEEPLELIKSTDFSTIDILTIAYGTNDFMGNNALDNAENPLDTSTVGGALRYSIETLLTAYPNLRIVILSLTYRFWADDSNIYTDDSNTRINNNGDTILDFNAKLAEIAKEYNLPFIDNYNVGIGKFNRYQYFSTTDGTHHIEAGRKLIAEHLAGTLTSCVSGGQAGKDGADGYTPVKGTDYFTDEDKAGLVNDVLAALPTWSGGAY